MMRAIKDRYNISSGETSTCGRFSLLEVECLGACVNAPILQVNDDYYEDLDYQTTSVCLTRWKLVTIAGRISSWPSGVGTTEGATTLGSHQARGQAKFRGESRQSKKRRNANA